jgi:hypothetical protein
MYQRELRTWAHVTVSTLRKLVNDDGARLGVTQNIFNNKFSTFTLLTAVGDDLPSLQRESHAWQNVNPRLTPFCVASYVPSPPIVIPSETPTVLNCHPIMPRFCTAAFTVFPRSRTEIRVINGN